MKTTALAAVIITITIITIITIITWKKQDSAVAATVRQRKPFLDWHLQLLPR